ncbi:hypothetical protein TRFO_06474 [Tritrichomonas foetus]|uniref:protein disulfide-isomerase n=1 Tax=Tritrichomonas foetus TaxID=1144522 RepID=A0A1J4K3T9_9EUKA|nr:hypothetical protein TRFO_06474 [Tritrichomonas foetus]|eukprot:OHT04149.1 hypothetical protein TRFO_06474 [Tritrichomonas foetus]
MFFFPLFSLLVSSRRRTMAAEKFNKDNDPVHYMRELEFKNTIDQYDLGIVLFFRKDVDECKRMLPGFRYAAQKSLGRADFIAVSAKAAADLCDELGVDTYPTVFTFRNGHLIEKLVNRTSSKDLYYYVKNVTAAKYKYIHDPSLIRPTLLKHNVTLVISVKMVDARLDKLLAVISTKFFKDLQIIVSTSEEVSKGFNIDKFPSITIMRKQDDANISFTGDPTRTTVKSLSDFVEKNIKPRYELITSFHDVKDELYFVSLFDTTNEPQSKFVKDILEKVSADHLGKFKIRYADALQLRRNLTIMNIQNFTIPIFMFLRTDRFGYNKYIYQGKQTPLAVSAFCSDQIRGRNPETIIDSKVTKPSWAASKSNILLKFFTGSELKKSLESDIKKDYVVNFVGFPCLHCDEVDALFDETAQWAKANNVRDVIFARVNATSNDIPNTVWRNETFPYGWFFPARDRGAAFPIGKRRQLYWMAQLLADNCTTPFQAQLPPKPTKTPAPHGDDL